MQISPTTLRNSVSQVADFTYIQTHSGWVYTAFIIDVFSRAIVGWKVSTRMNTDMVLDALEQALHDRGMPKNVIHHSDRGVQYLSIRYTALLHKPICKGFFSDIIFK